MAKATLLLLTLLALIATLLFGINIGKKIEQWQQTPSPTPKKVITPPKSKASFTPTKTASPSAIPKDKMVYRNTNCGYEIVYPKSWIKTEYDARSIALAESQATESSRVAIVCTTEIPKPPLPPDKIEKITLSTISATLYHDSSPLDGSPLDEVIATIPGKNMEIFIAGFGDSLQEILSSFRFLQ